MGKVGNEYEERGQVRIGGDTSGAARMLLRGTRFVYTRDRTLVPPDSNAHKRSHTERYATGRQIMRGDVASDFEPPHETIPGLYRAASAPIGDVARQVRSSAKAVLYIEWCFNY